MGSRELRVAVAASALALGAAPAEARRLRPRFEPTDLRFKDTGMLELDLQFGFIAADGPSRVVVPDVELEIGILPKLEFEADAAYAVEGPTSGPFALDHAAPDNLWLTAKIGVVDVHDDDDETAWAIGVQIGPRLPLARDASGLGVAGLLLLGRTVRATHVVLQAGATIDPDNRDPTSPGRPIGLPGGIDFERKLGETRRLALLAELAGVHYLSRDADQAYATAGVSWEASSHLEISLVGLLGLLPQGDRWGVLVGMTPKLQLWR